MRSRVRLNCRERAAVIRSSRNRHAYFFNTRRDVVARGALPPMSRARARRIALASWSGLFAIWLALVAPVVTQLLPESAQDGALSSISSLSTMCSAHLATASTGDAQDHSAPHGHHAKWCGYCNLFAHHPPLASAAFAAWLPPPPHACEAARFITSLHGLTRFTLARSRAPPFAVS
jgi:hypothetical protein